MKVIQLQINPFSFTSLEHFSFKKSVNDHAEANIVGVITAANEQQYLQMALSEQNIVVNGIDEYGNKAVLFNGFLEDFKIVKENMLSVLHIKAISFSKMMDLKEKSQSFQNAKMQYEDLLKFVISGYATPNVIMSAGKEAELGNLIVQYKETDWEFVKRLASHFKTIVVPDTVTNGTHFYFGIPERQADARIASPISFSIKKDVCEHLFKVENEVTQSESDEIAYALEERETGEIGDRIQFQNDEFLIYETSGEWVGSELINTHVLKKESGFQVPWKYNPKILGASIDGNVSSVQNDMVMVTLGVDKSNTAAGAKWFAYATVYSSPDGTGWYAMPEKGDEIRLYFPTEREKHAYVNSAVHVNGAAGGGYRSNPDSKSLSTVYGKTICLEKDRIYIENGGGLSITMEDASGIFIKSNSDVKIESANNVDISSTAGDIEFNAADKLVLKQGGATITLEDEKVLTKGAQFRVEEG